MITVIKGIRGSGIARFAKCVFVRVSTLTFTLIQNACPSILPLSTANGIDGNNIIIVVAGGVAILLSIDIRTLNIKVMRIATIVAMINIGATITVPITIAIMCLFAIMFVTGVGVRSSSAITQYAKVAAVVRNSIARINLFIISISSVIVIINSSDISTSGAIGITGISVGYMRPSVNKVSIAAPHSKY